MAIQIRRGLAADFDETRLLGGELAVTTDTDELYYKGSTVKKVQTELTFDSEPSEDSPNPVTSGGLYDALEEIQQTIDSDISSKMGDLSNLTTDAKGTLVNAINEVDSHADANASAIASAQTDIGTKANLETEDKTDLVSAINEVNEKADDNADAISDLNDALTDTQDELEDVINSISTLVPSTPANSFDVTEYAGKSIPKVTSSISVSSAMSSVDLYCCGKNHLKLKSDTKTTSGITWTTDPVNGTVTLNGKATGKVNLFFEYNNSPFANVCHVYNTKWRASINKSAQNDGVTVGFNGNPTGGDVYTYNASQSNYARLASICIELNTVCDNLVVQPMVEFGDYPETVTFEPFHGFIKTHTFDSAVTTADVDWGVVEIPENATTMWIYTTTNLTTIYEYQNAIDNLSDAIDDLSDQVDALVEEIGDLDGAIDDAYAHRYEPYVSGWEDAQVTYYNTGFIDDSGNVVTYGTNAYRYSDFIVASKNDTINYNAYGATNIVTFYDPSKARISSVKGNSGTFNTGTAIAPDNTAYIRISMQIGSPMGDFSMQKWTVRTGDETKADIKEYADSLVTLVQEDVVLTAGDVQLIYGTICNDRGIFSCVNGVRTDYIPVSEGDIIEYRLWNYFLSPLYQYAIVAYDETKTKVSHVAGTGEDNGYVSGTYTVPNGVSYVMLSWSLDYLSQNGWFKITLSSLSQRLLDYIPLLSNRPTSPLKGKQWCCLGDSITSGAYDVRPYYDWVQDRTAITPYNFGLSSTTIAKSGSGDTLNFVTRYPNMYDDVDYVTVLGGTNDHGRSLPIGQWGDADDMTLYGAMKMLCEGLINKYVGKKIGFMTPLPKCTTTEGVTTDYSYPSTSFLPYIECIKDVCARYSIPVLDLYTQSDLHPSISAFRTAMMPDGLHPNSDGQELLSYRIQAFLESL